MSSWLLPATAATLLASLLLLLIFCIVYKKNRDEFTGWWIAGWSFYTVRNISDVLIAANGTAPLLQLLSHEATALSAIILLLAVLKMVSEQSYVRHAVIAGVLFTLWIVPGTFAINNFFILTLPTFTFFGAVHILTGYCFYQYNKRHSSLGARIVGLAMIIWGLHKLDYPFLRPVEWFAPWGYILAALLELLVGIGILILLYERLERKAVAIGERLRLIFDNSRDAIFVHKISPEGGAGKFLEVNDIACQRLGYSREELLNMTPQDIDDPEEFKRVPEIIRRNMFGKEGYVLFEMVHVAKDGTKIPVEINSLRFSLDGEPAVLSVARDISDRIKAEQQLRESHKRLLRVLDSLDAVVYVATMDSHEILYANRKLMDICGDITGKICWQVLHIGQTGPCAFCTNDKLLTPEGKPAAAPYVWEFENSISGRWYNIHDKAIEWVDGRIVRLEIATDITSRKQAEQALEKELAVSSTLTELSSRMIGKSTATKEIAEMVLEKAKMITKSSDGYVATIDPKTAALVSHTIADMLPGQCDVREEKKNIYFPVGPDGHYGSLWGHSLNNKEPFYTNEPETHIASKGLPEGHIPVRKFLSVPVLFSDELIGQIALANPEQDYTAGDLAAIERLAGLYALAIHRQRDQEEKERLMGELRQAQKMEAIGTLAGGIAHDFNNILYAMLGYAELSMTEVAKDSGIYQNLSEIVKGGKRAADLVRQILTFCRKAEQEKKPVQLQPIVKEALKLMRGTLPTTIDIRQQIDPHCRPILADITQIHQVIVNLCTNAYHAMRDQGGILSVNLTEVDKTHALHELQDLPGEAFVKLSIADTGSGMDQKILERIFDPYFTTKDHGEGTGLGLSTVHGIVKSHGGTITVRSTPGQGSCFDVYLPVLEEKPALNLKSETTALPKVHGRVLFVDDEATIAELGGKILKQIGVEAEVFTSSVAALAAFEAAPHAFDAVITDQTMPGLTGMELAKKILELRPDTPIILTTGFSESVSEEQAKAVGIKEFMLKPLSLEVITWTVSRLLNPNKPRHH